MSLIGSIHIGNNALFAAQIGLQVTGNNIANANTPGYLRQQAILTPAPVQLIGDLPLGLGVEVQAIIQQTDRLAERLRGAISDLSNSEAQENTYLALEALIGELSDTDLSTSMSNFFGAIHDILNQPEDVAVRNFAVFQGATLTDDVKRLTRRAREMRTNINQEVIQTADHINRLTEELADLNVKIVVTEGGGTRGSDAVGLRDQREMVLEELASIIGIRAVEQPNGAVTVFSGGDYLVADGVDREVNVVYTPDRGISAATINVADSDSPLAASSGRLAGLYATRDEVLGGFLDDMDGLSQTLAFEFNKIFSSGQGLTGHQDLTSEFYVDQVDAALDQAGLQFTPVNGSFQILVHNTRTDTTETEDIFVELNGLDDDTTLTDLAAALDAVDGIQAAVTSERKLNITSESPVLEFSFADDTSGLLAALGMNTFFTGSSGDDLGVSDVVREDPSLFTASRGGIGADTNNAVLLADFGDQALESTDGESIVQLYERMTAETTQASSVTQAVTEGFRVFQRTLESQKMSVSGVSIDDEAVKMITYQRAYQASARFIAAVSDLLNVLVNL